MFKIDWIFFSCWTGDVFYRKTLLFTEAEEQGTSVGLGICR